jgi:hypothetical protein
LANSKSTSVDKGVKTLILFESNMKKPNFCLCLCIFVSTIITICHPTFQLAATTSLTSQEISEPSEIVGSLENGVTYTIAPSSKLKGGAWIKLTCSIPTEEEQAPVSLLTQHSLFYGTQKYDRQQIASKLNALGLDVEADSFLQSNESGHSLHFCIPDSQPTAVRELLELLHQMAFFPTLKTGDIELARRHLLSTLENLEQDALPFQCITASEIQKFHAQSYRPKHIHISLIGVNQPKEFLTILSEVFRSEILESQEIQVPEIAQLPPEMTKEGSLASSFAERVEWAQDNQCLIVDNKIWMKEPNWINKSSNGKKLGALLTILGIGGMFLVIPFVGPGIIVGSLIAGSLSTVTGIYFLTTDYLKDPHYVESVRQIDLQKGCYHAYKNSRAGITLTPYERRALFLQEMVDHPNTMPKPPILALADVYQLHDPVIAEIFTVDEFNVLTRIKRDFIQQRNQYKLLKELLEKELAIITAPHAIARDAALSHAQDVYNHNQYVTAKYALQLTRDESIAEINKSFENNKISLEERDSMIDQTRNYYDACISTPEFKAGLASAEITLVQMEIEIQTAYDYQVELCKQAIQYNQRMDYYTQGENALISYYNQELTHLLATFPVYLTILPDFLDLRNL